MKNDSMSADDLTVSNRVCQGHNNPYFGHGRCVIVAKDCMSPVSDNSAEGYANCSVR